MSENLDTIGHITDVSAHHITATLTDDYPEKLSASDHTSVTHAGAHLLIKAPDLQLLVRVVRSWIENGITRLQLMPLGDISSDGRFSRGVSQYPR